MKRRPTAYVAAFAAAAILASSTAAVAQTTHGPADSDDIGAKSLRLHLATLQEPTAGAVPLVEARALALTAGAIGGVVAFNLVTGGTGSLPFLAGAAAAEIVPASAFVGPVAVSRVFAVTSAAAGALVADWIYRSSAETPGTIQSQPHLSAATLERIEPPRDIMPAMYYSGGTDSRRQ